MRPMLISFAMILAASPAFAGPPASNRAAATLASACMSDCMSVMMSRAGQQPDAGRICQLRCNAAGQFYQAQVQSQQRPQTPPAPPPRARREGPVLQAAAPVAAHGVIFVGRAPSAGYGIVAGSRDRLAAYRVAEEQCRVQGTGCRILLEFTSSCGAVAHGVRRSGSAIMMTSSATTQVISSASAGQGATREAAEADALADCRSRDRGATCRIAAASCGGR